MTPFYILSILFILIPAFKSDDFFYVEYDSFIRSTLGESFEKAFPIIQAKFEALLYDFLKRFS